MNKKNRNKIVKEVVETVVEKKIQDETKKPSFWLKVLKFSKFILTFLIKSGLWVKLGLSKYWKNVGIILALVGTTYNTVNDNSGESQIINELVTLTQYIDSLETVSAVKDSIYAVQLDSLRTELDDYSELKTAIRVVK